MGSQRPLPPDDRDLSLTASDVPSQRYSKWTTSAYAERRTRQICTDVVQALDAGRTCLVLTQRTAHIDAICHRLASTGHDVHILKGGLGKKALAAVHDAMAAPGKDTGIVVVATGSYLGEGFDWPQLDTLFLAFPIAFKGRVVQYVGRLLRAHSAKHDVELHDYVDNNINVLARMHTKRLRAYKTLGFSGDVGQGGLRGSRALEP